jgi:hypothetical protein
MNGVLWVAAWWALGIPSSLALWRRGERFGALGVLPIAGALALVLPLPLLIAWGVPLVYWPAAACVACVLLGLCAAWALRGEGGESAPPIVPLEDGLAFGGIALLCAGIAWVGATLADGWPGYGWDGFAIWLLRAKVLVQSEVVPAELFREPALVESHWDYPLAFPALIAWVARGADLGVREFAVALAGIAASLLLALTLVFRSRVAAPWAAALALLPWAMPVALALHFGGYADPMLASAVTLGVFGAVVGARERQAAPALVGGLALALVVATKNEGALWCVAATVGSVWLARLTGGLRRELLLHAARVALPSALLFGLWAVVRAQLGAQSDLLGSLRFDSLFARLPAVTGAMLAVAFQGAGGLVLLLALAGIGWGVGGSGRARLQRSVALAGVPLVYLLGLCGVYLTTPYDLGWHLSTSLPRTLLAVTPVCAVLAVLAPRLRDPGDVSAR